ncbi:MAG: adaptor protein MecA [Lachnospiraceae bacterium]|jgi:negative regulator of genetic competence, sporulation and motility
MKFIKLASNSFKCILSKQDFEDYNLTIHDFVAQDSEKIKSFITDICQRAEAETGIHLDGQVMSIQMAMQPDHTTVLTISSRNDMDDLFGDLRRDLGKRGNASSGKKQTESGRKEVKRPASAETNTRIYVFSSYGAFEKFAAANGNTWGIRNSLRKAEDGTYLFLISRGRASLEKYKAFRLRLLDFAEADHNTTKIHLDERMEHSKPFIEENAVNKVRKYL